jgi:hypothetical protein
MKAGYTTVEEVLAKDPAELLALSGVTQKTLDDLAAALDGPQVVPESQEVPDTEPVIVLDEEVPSEAPDGALEALAHLTLGPPMAQAQERVLSNPGASEGDHLMNLVDLLRAAIEHGAALSSPEKLGAQVAMAYGAMLKTWREGA